MELPDDYLDLLADELAPFGLEFESSALDDENVWQIRFEAEPENFVAISLDRDRRQLRQHPGHRRRWNC